jgi:hypothetical protein
MRVNLTTATVREIHYRKPSGATGVWTGATLVGTNTLRHVTVGGDIDEFGAWDFQPYAEKPSWKGWGRMQTVMVEDHI